MLANQGPGFQSEIEIFACGIFSDTEPIFDSGKTMY